MKICILGSGAGENYPDPWCSCPNCEYAREHGGRNVRASSAIWVNEDLMIDMTESSVRNAVRFKRNLNAVRYLLVTHAHSDHFTPNQLWHRWYDPALLGLSMDEIINKKGAPCVTPREHLDIYGTHYVGQAILAAEDLKGDKAYYGYTFHPIRAGDVFSLGDYEVTAIGSPHSGDDYTLNYILRRGGITFLYALDTPGYSVDTLAKITRYRYDLIIMEGTHGLMEVGENPGHMNLTAAKAFFEQLRQCGSIDDSTRLMLSHLSPHWTPPHDLLVPKLKKEGIGVAYDGQIIGFEG